MKYISYTIASLMTLAMMLIFTNMGSWMQMAATLPFMKVDPWISGGEVSDSIVGDTYKIYLHEAVYKGLFVEDEDGYVQVDVEGKYEGDITIGESNYELNSDETQIRLLDARSGEEVNVKRCHTKEGWAIRVCL